MAISQTNYVDITSAVAGASATGSPSLQHRRITSGGLRDAQGNAVPNGGMITVTYGMLDILNSILDSSDDRAFAQQYFGIKTTAPANKPSSLQFVYVDTAAGPVNSVLTGGTIADPTDAQALESEVLTITVLDGSPVDVTLTGFGSVATIGDIVTALNLLSFPVGLVFSDNGSGLIATYAETGSAGNAVLRFSGAAADVLKLTESEGASVVLGGVLTPVDAYIASRQANKNFGTFTIQGLKDEPQPELTKLKNYHLSYNVLHQLYIELDSKVGIDSLPVYTTFKDVPMTGFILSEKAGEFKAVIPAGLIDATDFEGRNTVNQVMYRQASGMTADVDNDVDKFNLDGLLVNYYGVTSVNATPLSFFQKGNLQGTVADPRDMMVAACEQWIKGKVSSDLINTLVASRIPANLDGKTRIRTIIVNGAVASALRSGAILKLKELTPLQKEVIFDMSGDELAAMDVFNNGYWLDVAIRTVVVDGIEEKHAHYVLIYAKADFVRKIVGSHNLI